MVVPEARPPQPPGPLPFLALPAPIREDVSKGVAGGALRFCRASGLDPSNPSPAPQGTQAGRLLPDVMCRGFGGLSMLGLGPSHRRRSPPPRGTTRVFYCIPSGKSYHTVSKENRGTRSPRGLPRPEPFRRADRSTAGDHPRPSSEISWNSAEGATRRLAGAVLPRTQRWKPFRRDMLPPSRPMPFPA